MSHKHSKPHIPYCLNCHYPLAEFDSFCPNCGQKPTDGKVTMHDLGHEFMHSTFHVDGKLFTTLRHIFVPGKLTIEFFKGHHKRYAHPIQLFLVLGALVFGMVSSAVSKFEKSTEESTYKQRRKVEEKRMYRLMDSLGTDMAKKLNGAETKRAYDSLLVKTYQYKEGGDFDWAKFNGEMKEALKDLPVKVETHSDSSNDERTTSKSDSTEDKTTPESDTTKDKGSWTELKEGFKAGFESGKRAKVEGKSAVDIVMEDVEKKKKAEKKKEIPQKQNVLDLWQSRDSSSLGQWYKATKIADEDIYTLSVEEIIEKYHIKGFWETISLKQDIKTRQDAKSLIHFVVGRLLWFILTLIPLMSGLFVLLYRKRHYFVEHFIFFMHYCLYLFAATILIISINNQFHYKGLNRWFILSVFVFLYLAMKNFYKQGWGKTFLKFSIACFGYAFLSTLVFAAGMVLSFLLF